MKLVLIDSSITGHHVPYIQALSNLADETIAILPEELTSLSIPQRICSFPRSSQRRFSDFLRWVKAVKSIVDQEKPDIVHFLMGDDFYRFFGAGLGLFARYKVVVTLHWMRGGFAGRLSTRCIARHADSVVVHSEYIQQKLSSYGIGNAVHIEYPQFGTSFYPMEEARVYWQLEQDIPVIACIGGTRYDKGLDILLEALNRSRSRFSCWLPVRQDISTKRSSGKRRSLTANLCICTWSFYPMRSLPVLSARRILSPFRTEGNLTVQAVLLPTAWCIPK